MGELTTALIIVSLVVLIYLFIRLNRRVSRGSDSAGPRHVEQSVPVGQKATPWELEAIDAQLSAHRTSTARQDLIATVNRLAAASDRPERVQGNADNGEIDHLIALVEGQLLDNGELSDTWSAGGANG